MTTLPTSGSMRSDTAKMHGSGGIRLLASDELREAITLAEVVDAVEDAYRQAGLGRLAQDPRIQVRDPSTHTFLSSMPAVSGAAGFAVAHLYTGGNKGRLGPQKVTLVFRTEDGALEAVIESEWLSWARTGATGAVASRFLARPDATRLGIMGSGRQAAAQLLCHVAVRRIESCFVYSRSQEGRRRFAASMSDRAGMEIVSVDDPAEVVRRSEIISTATTSPTPVFPASAVSAGLHINAMGQHYPDRREIDETTVRMSRVIADDIGRCLQEDGELLLPAVHSGRSAPKPDTSLAEVVAGTAAGRTGSDEITLFLSGGLASEYLAVAAMVVQRARALGLGKTVEL